MFKNWSSILLISILFRPKSSNKIIKTIEKICLNTTKVKSHIKPAKFRNHKRISDTRDKCLTRDTLHTLMIKMHQCNVM